MSALPEFSDDRKVEAEFQEAEEKRAGGCLFCGRPVDALDYRRVFGWVGGSGKDGFIRDGYGDEFAHRVCIQMEKTVGRDQGALDV